MLKKKTMAIVFANMHDQVMGELTERRSMASLPYGGRYRMIDFYLSSLVNAGIAQVGVVAKENYHSLLEHLGTGREWDLARKIEGLSFFPPFSEADSGAVYHGRIEALHNVVNYMRKSTAKYVIMMDCDFICMPDVEGIVNRHIESGADISIVCCDIPSDNAQGATNNCVVITPDQNGRVVELALNVSPPAGSHLSMNMFVMEKELLIDLVEDARSRMLVFFERDILQANVGRLRLRADLVGGPIKRIYDIRSFYDANMALLDAGFMRELFYGRGPVYTKVRDDAPTRYGLDSLVKNSIVADGCVIEGSVENSVLFRGVHVEPGASVRDSIVMQDSVIGSGARLESVITDKSVAISPRCELIGHSTYPMYIRKDSRV